MTKPKTKLTRQKLWLSLFFLLLCSCLSVGNAKRVALVIGNNNYTYSSQLRNPVKDATDIADSLKVAGFEVDLQTNLDLVAMKEAVRNFGNRIQPNDIALFYYSGHGTQVNGRNYLIPTTADIRSADEVEFESFDVHRVISKLITSGSKINIVILDACRNNPYKGSKDDSEGLAAISDIQGQFLIGLCYGPQ